MMKKIFMIFTLVLFCLSGYAQFPCGIDQEDIALITSRLKLNKKTIAEGFVNERSGAILYLPVKFHLVGKTDGSLRITEDHVLRQLNLLNENYLDQEIQFFIEDSFNYVNNTAAFNDPSAQASQLVLNQNKVNGRINIYICRTAMTGGGSLGTTLGFYSPFSDWIVIRQVEVTSLTSTLTHEMGHFLSLLHPHNGWDAVNYNVMDHTPTPEFSPSGIETENEARSGSCKNCESAGDFLCDTPPDYNFGFGWNDCDYDRGTLDPCGDVVDVQENNYMGYFGDCDSYVFTPQQKQLMEVDVAARLSQETILENLTPNSTDLVEGDVKVNLPEDGGISYQAQSVYFNWEPVEGATDYLFEVTDSIAGFSAATRVMVSGTNDILIDEPFLPNRTYIWRIYPYNESSTGYGFSKIFRFKSGPITSVATIKEVSSFDIYPNLVSNQNSVLLDINSTEVIDLDVQLLSLAGKAITTMESKLTSGQNKIDLNVNGLTNGVYIVKIASKNGIISKKLVVKNM